MKIRMLVSIAGSHYSFAAGDVVELTEIEATRMVAVGYAEPVKATRGKAEKATAPETPVETATAD